MNGLMIHLSIEGAERKDFVPLCGEDDEPTLIPCLDLFYDSGILELVHTPIVEPFVIKPEYVRFDARGPLDPSRLRQGLAVGGALHKALVEIRCAAIMDRGLLSACHALSTQLEDLIEDDVGAASDRTP